MEEAEASDGVKGQGHTNQSDEAAECSSLGERPIPIVAAVLGATDREQYVLEEHPVLPSWDSLGWVDSWAQFLAWRPIGMGHP